jgi:heme exporter protein A
MQEKIITANNLTLHRNDTAIFSNISIDILKSQITNIYGHNGSGKTSLLKILVGITEATNGEVKNVSGDTKLFNRTIYIGHRYGLKNNLSINENLIYLQSFYGVSQKQLIDEAIDMYGMTKYKNTLIKYLSHGQQKRASLMKTLITNSKLWIIDEPYGALDDEAVEMFNKTAKKHLSNNGSLIITNHKPITNIFPNAINFKLN